MPGSTWLDLKSADFKPFPPIDQMKEKIKYVRKLQKALATKELTSTAFFELAGAAISGATWSEVRNVIKRSGGPEVPSHVQSIKGGPEIPLQIESIPTAMGVLYPVPGDHEQFDMLVALARCAAVRIAVIRSDLLSAPKDWWIRLILTDLWASFAQALPDYGSEIEE